MWARNLANESNPIYPTEKFELPISFVEFLSFVPVVIMSALGLMAYL